MQGDALLEDQEPWERTRGLKLLCRFSLLKAEGVLIWNSPELLSPCSTGETVTLRGLKPSLLLLYMDSPARPGLDSCSRIPVSPLLWGEEEAARPFSSW